MAIGRTCVDCDLWLFDAGSGPYSEWTPGEDWSSQCMARIIDESGVERVRWYLGGTSATQDEFRDALKSATDCPDFTPRVGGAS